MNEVGPKTEAADRRSVQALRTETVARLMLRGWNRRRIFDWVERESAWNVSTRTVERLMRRASVALAREAQRNTNLETEFAMARARIESLFVAALNQDTPDLRTALMCQRELIDLLGLAAARPEPKTEREAVTFQIIGATSETPE